MTLRLLRLLPTVLILTSCALLQVPVPLNETPHISGQVVSARTHAPLVAHVYFKVFPEQGVFSSSNGRFELQPIRQWQRLAADPDHQSSHTLVVEAPGYRQKTQSIEFEGPSSFAFSLEPL